MTEFRITESGDFRITEALDSRILEKFGPTFNGFSSISIKPTVTFKSKFEAFIGFADRFTETGDTRITENGLIRSTEPFNSNSGSSSITLTSNRIVFDSELFVKYLSNWKISTPYVKYQNNWVIPIAIYKYVDNNWKRVD